MYNGQKILPMGCSGIFSRKSSNVQETLYSIDQVSESVAFNDLFLLIALSLVGALLLLNWILFLNTHQLERDIGAAFLICALFLAFDNVKTIIPQPGMWGPIPSCLLASQDTDWLLILQTLKEAFCSTGFGLGSLGFCIGRAWCRICDRVASVLVKSFVASPFDYNAPCTCFWSTRNSRLRVHCLKIMLDFIS
jgi:hypothetical protein